MKKFFVIGFLLFFPLFLFAQQIRMVKPSDTDKSIDIADNYHYAFVNPGHAYQKKLVLFLPGTRAVPMYYRAFLKKASSMGFHSLGLSYPNDTSVNLMCRASEDPYCHENARNEICFGKDLSSIIEVNKANCIRNRLIKALMFLDEKHPEDGWSIYLKNNQPVWENIIIAGHSQGATHAAFIAKKYTVHRVIMFAAIDWYNYHHEPASWISQSGKTPSAKYYGFTHLKDPWYWGKDSLQLRVWESLGMQGPIINVDFNKAPFLHSRMLVTSIRPKPYRGDLDNFHGSTIVNVYTPMLKNKRAILEFVWEYLLTGNE